MQKPWLPVRKQVPVVAQNICDSFAGKTIHSGYDGYGSCPLTVERGKIVLAEFGYGGKIIPTFPTWMLQGKKPTRSAWVLKKDILPGVYWSAMLKGREWLAQPRTWSAFRLDMSPLSAALPITRWSSHYTRDQFVSDGVAAVIVAIMLIPSH